MIISAPPVQRKRSVEEPKRPVVAGGEMAGIEVVVVVESVYNGPNHKSLGTCKVGQIVTVAAGTYAQSLLIDGLVKRVDSDETVASTVAEMLADAIEALASVDPLVPTLTPTEEPDDGAWKLLLEAEITERQAKLIAAAGFGSKEAIAKSITEYGTSQLTDLNGIGINTALKLAKWAGVDITAA